MYAHTPTGTDTSVQTNGFFLSNVLGYFVIISTFKKVISYYNGEIS